MRKKTNCNCIVFLEIVYVQILVEGVEDCETAAEQISEAMELMDEGIVYVEVQINPNYQDICENLRRRVLRRNLDLNVGIPLFNAGFR